MNVAVCIGSACHLHGSYDVKTTFQRMITENHLEDQVHLEVAFCLGHCKDGVTIRVGEEIVTGVNKDNAEEIFRQKIMNAIK